MPSPKVWSFSTTIRAPERIRGFLHVLKMLEGVEYDQESQVRFQTLLIKEKKYRPTNLTEEEKTVCQDPDVAFSEEQASEIFNRQGYEDPPMRGRTSFAPLVEMGLAYVDDERLIRISELGKYFLSEDYDISKVFLRFLIKWQYPNPLSTHFSEVRGFNVKPFLVTLHLIKRVNELWAEEGNEPVGLSNDEFNMFTATLINYEDIESQAQRLIEYRKAVRSRPGREQPAFKEQYKHDFVAAHFDINDESAIRTQIDNLRDYGDNARRLFRLSQYLHIRGKGHFVDLEPLRTAEITPLLSEFDGSADAFPSVEAYTDYMVNMNLPRLPWINVESLTAIAQTVVDDIKVIQHLITDRGGSFDEAPEEDPSGMSEGQLEDYIELLRSYRRELQLSQQILESQDAEVIEEPWRNMPQLL
ncbi:MAG: hypothetical protein CVT63_01570 [Candidatus Anoxymicrobium japonicum]|uniref:AlwI restriction endonuclease n=1 Tax=Candidatus Anoxymicrobium japonicum TaxID=2013648 RepID=A0A2N3G7U2_9ACTN|nr:MAG: hypothetical protein CVT63_01570 [Candidatus Anoxymicrobium japonicum]